MTIRRMRFTFQIPKATNTQSEYVILLLFLFNSDGKKGAIYGGFGRKNPRSTKPQPRLGGRGAGPPPPPPPPETLITSTKFHGVTPTHLLPLEPRSRSSPTDLKMTPLCRNTVHKSGARLMWPPVVKAPSRLFLIYTIRSINKHPASGVPGIVNLNHFVSSVRCVTYTLTELKTHDCQLKVLFPADLNLQPPNNDRLQTLVR